jgi:ribonuclease P protein component
VKRRFRLTRSTDFQRVRRSGKSYAHPLIVLIVLPNELDSSRVAVSAGRAVGKAVDRNFAKRRLREAIRSLYPAIASGWDILVIARHPISSASFLQIQNALETLFKRARILKEPHVD